MPEPIVFCLNPSTLPLARKISELLGGKVHGPARRVPEADETFHETTAHLQDLFAQGHPLVGICASGILIRSLAPVLQSKHTEPPVLAISEDGGSVVPLLGGHHEANQMARKVAADLGGHAALTTAGDVRFGIALDEPPDALVLANPQDAKAFMAELLSGASVRLQEPHPWLLESAVPWTSEGLLEVRVTPESVPGTPRRLVFHPKTLALGVGCERGCEVEELWQLVESVLTEHHLAPESLAGVFSVDLKADEPAVHELAERLGAPARFFPAAVLEQETPRLQNPSERVFREVGCHGVAEGAALAAVGIAGALRVPKRKSRRATCALAQAPEPLDAQLPGAACGVLSVVGTGPGSVQWRLPETVQWLQEATDWVGYTLYLELVEDLRTRQERHEFPLGAEIERVRHALDLAASGKKVALISSGDPGIYAMATLVFELLEREAQSAWRRVRVRVGPGISAMQAAAARVGAPLGHDFCAVSLSDLLTPREVILERLHAAASGDFVTALYNPVSQRRTELLGRARDLFLQYRSAETPVVLARSLGRPEEQIRIVRLEQLEAAEVDMLTVVLIGARNTRELCSGANAPHVFTPRGYERKSA